MELASFKRDIPRVTLLVVITLAAYFPVFHAGFTNWDDNIFVTSNELIRSLNFENIAAWFFHPFEGQFQPFVLFSFALDYAIAGYNPFVFHLTNVVLHLLNVLLLYSILKRILSSASLAFFVTLLFAIHPVQVESVAWITERKNVLFVFFYLLSLYFFLDHSEGKRKKRYTLSLLFFGLSLLSKSAAVTLPLVLFMVDYVLERNIPWRRSFLEKTPFLIMALVTGILTILAHYDYGALENSTGYAWYTRIVISGTSLLLYFRNFIFPLELSPFYPMPEGLTDNKAMLILTFLVVWGVTGGLILYFFFKKIRIPAFGLMFFVVNIFLFIIPAGVPVLATDRYAYISFVGLFITFGWLLQLGWRRLKTKRNLSISIFFKDVVLIILLLPFILKTYSLAKAWNSSLTLWDHVIETTGETPVPLLKRGMAHSSLGNYEEALIDLIKCIEKRPGYAQAYESRGYIFMIQGDLSIALVDFRKAHELEPRSVYALQNLGLLYYRKGNQTKALKYLNRSLVLDPENAYALKTRGKVYIAQEDTQNACIDLKKALEIGLSSTNEEEALNLLSVYCNSKNQ